MKKKNNFDFTILIEESDLTYVITIPAILTPYSYIIKKQLLNYLRHVLEDRHVKPRHV